MCGGIGFKISKYSKKKLREYFSDEQIDEASKTGELNTFFWSKSAVLPVVVEGKDDLAEWGNKDKNVSLPLTGWAREESINTGKWNHLNPSIVVIPAVKGFEKGVWFDIKGGIKGIIVSKNDQRRVYIETQPSTLKYKKLTHHDREPIFLNSYSSENNL